MFCKGSLISLSFLLINTFFSHLVGFERSDYVYTDKVYKPYLHTVKLVNDGTRNLIPVIDMQKNNRLMLTFDDLRGDFTDMEYTIIHCDIDWRESDLMTNDYIDGMNSDYISEYDFSFNTFVKFTNYQLMFPNENMRPTKPGNYVLKVYAAGNKDDVFLTRRFLVVDRLISVDGKVRQSTQARFRRDHHEVVFDVDYSRLSQEINPYTDIKVVVLQNYRWDMAITDLEPLYARADLLNFGHQEGNQLPAGNEFRSFDTRSVQFKRFGIENISFDSVYNFRVMQDVDRSRLTYTNRVDMNGQRVIAADNSQKPHLESDYANVYFHLKYDGYLEQGEEIYVFGALSDWQPNERFRMKYNSKKNLYEATVLLKQGFYNYEYIIYREGDEVFDNTRTEGSFFETENNYTVLVYYRNRYLNVYHLAGMSSFNSGLDKEQRLRLDR